MTDPAPYDTDAAALLWERYVAAFPDAAASSPEYTVERFGDSARLADELLGHVLSGRKRATATLLLEFAAENEPLPRIGGHWIVCDGAGRPQVVVRTVELRLSSFADVDEAFAHDEGEDDRTLASWRREHTRYWQRRCTALGRVWSPDDDLILLERFDVVFPA